MIEKIIEDKQWINQLRELFDISYSDEEMIQYIKTNPESFIVFYQKCNQYHDKNIIQDTNLRSIRGRIDLSKIPKLRSNRAVNGSFCKGFYIFPDMNTYLIKDPVPIKSKMFYHNIVIPSIAKQFQLDSAQYYWTEKGQVISPNFLKRGEELIPGNNIGKCDGVQEYDMDYALENIEEFLLSIGMDRPQIEIIKIKYIKQSFFNKFIEQSDEVPKNWGIIINSQEDSARIAPLYDFDFCCFGKKLDHKRFVLQNGNMETDIQSFISYYSHLSWFEAYVYQYMQDFDINKALKDSEQRTGIVMLDEYKNRYLDYFRQRKQILQQVYKNVYKKGRKNNGVSFKMER